MSQRAVFRGLLHCLACFSVAVLVGGSARAQTNGGTITFSPATVTFGVGETSPVVTAQIAFAPPYAYAGTNTLVFPYLPYGVTTQPSTITFNTVAGQQTATVSFRLVAEVYAYATSSEASANTSPSYAYGLLNFEITPFTVLPSSASAFTGSETPTLTAIAAYGEVAPRVPQQLTFAGLPPGATPVPSPVSFTPEPQLGYAVVPFQIAVDDLAPAGTYRVTVGTSPVATGTDTFVLTVYKSGSLAVALGQTSITTCPGGAPVTNTVTVTPLDGYSGPPVVSFPALPGDLKVTPTSIPLGEISAPTTATFQIEALPGALPGVKVVNVRARDPYGPSAATSFLVNVGAADYLPLVTPAEVSVESGGAPVTVTASLAPGSCSPPDRITVTPTGLPTGVTSNPASADLVGPAYAPVTFTITAGSTAPAGIVPISFTFTPSTGAAKSVGVPVTVVRNGHIGVEVERSSMDVCPGGAASPNTLTISSLDGYTGTPTVTFPDLPSGLSVAPATLATPLVPPSRVVSFTVAAAPGTAPGPLAVTALVSDPRGISATATFTANVLPPSYAPVVPGAVVTLNAGGAPVTVPVSLAAGDCAPTSAVTVTPSGLPPGVTATPASAQLLPPDWAPATFAFQASSSAAAGSSAVAFTFAASAGTPKTATIAVSVCGPPAAPVSPVVRARGNPLGPVTATDFLDLAWAAPASGFPPTRYEWRINGGTPASTAGTAAAAPPRGSVDPVQLFVRAFACDPEKGPGPEAASPVYSLAPPVASFSVSSPVVAGRPTTFTDTSSPQATSWLWFPGDGMPATTVQSPTVTFPSAGPKVVVLVATNGSGSSTKSATINVVASSPGQAAGLAVRALAREADGRLAIEPVVVAPGATLLLRRLGGEGEAVAFLRLVGADGQVAVERRLVLAAGEEARHDLSAWGAKGTFRVELVGPEDLDAAVEESAIRLGGPEDPVAPRRGTSR